MSGNLRGNESTGAFLHHIKQTTLPKLDWTKPNAELSLARTIRNSGIDADILAALDNQYGRVENPVYFMSGKKYHNVARTEERKERDREAQSPDPNAPDYELALRLQKYMNGRNRRLYDPVLARIDEALEAAKQIENKTVRGQMLSRLDLIYKDPKNNYSFSETGNTIRLFSGGDSVEGLRRDLRSILLKDYVAFDLAKSQLSLAALDWNVPILRDFLESGADIWRRFAEHVLERELTEEELGEVKPYIKNATYALVYGAKEPTIKAQITKGGIPSGQSKRFLNDPIVREILTKRQRQIEVISKEGGAYDPVQDRYLSVAEVAKRVDRKTNPVRSILSQLNQARELNLLKPVIEMAIEQGEKQRPTWQIAVWLWDGFYVRFRRSEAYHTKRIVEATNRHIEELGYPTFLEVG